ncbi:hypothetical protein GCM10011506_07350 [Marivirga lumbricoides]|uniref:Uncharacterized protein n=1 Tax=Marivirga lumbricoides TaxID=1046115 RepID=A0ABQ1LKF2_9BACT|nr:hypothetical protein GCM10011506_07350 [Marivirga lumbricoides]
MRYLFLVIFNLCILGEVLADCSSGGIWVYSTTTELNQNSIIVVEGYARSQRIIDSLNISYFIYLESGEQRIELDVLERCKGMFSITQALVRPKSKLTKGKTYTLKISNLDEWENRIWTKWNSEKEEYEPISWKVNDKLDEENPKWIKEPKLVDKTIIWYGCGPAIYVIFDLKINGLSNSLIKTELYNTNTKEENTYYLIMGEDGKLEVGHGMCSGAFDFEENSQYKIRFSLMGSSGNSDEKWTNWITFDSPYEGYK